MIKQHTSDFGRYYEKDGKYYPSVTFVNDVALPTSPHLKKYYKDRGHSADDVLRRAAEVGTNVHSAIELLLKGVELNSEAYSLTEQIYIMRFIEFFETNEVEVLETETPFVFEGDEYGYGGTIDFVGKVNGVMMLIDWKTSNGIYDSHKIQVAAYGMAYDKHMVESVALLHLDALTRGSSKTGIQGKGWKLEVVDNWRYEWYDRWQLARKTFNYIIPKEKQVPALYNIPKTFKIKLK